MNFANMKLRMVLWQKFALLGLFGLALVSVPAAFCWNEANQGTVVHVRGEYLPVLKSHEIFNIQPAAADKGTGIMVILESDGIKKALFVDELVGQHQVVIKGLETNYRRVRGVSGATIMGDGRVALIVDAGMLVRGLKPDLRAAA